MATLDDPAHINSARQVISNAGSVPHFAHVELDAIRVGDYPENAVAAGHPHQRADDAAVDGPRLLALIAALGLAVYISGRRRRR
jgi:hypothetical protein